MQLQRMCNRLLSPVSAMLSLEAPLEKTYKSLLALKPAISLPSRRFVWALMLPRSPQSSTHNRSCDIPLLLQYSPLHILGISSEFSFQCGTGPIYFASMQNCRMSRAIGAASLAPCWPPSTRTAIANFLPAPSTAKPPNQALSGLSVEPVLP